MAVFVLGENMVVHGKDVLKLCLGLWWEVFWKERFVWNVDFVEGGVVNFKEQGFKDFSEILVIFCLVYQETCVNCSVRRNIGWCGAICGVIAWQIAIFEFGHTLAEVELFVFLFVIKLFLNWCCSIDVLYFLLIFVFLFCDLFFVYKNFYLLSCLPTWQVLG